METLLLEQSSTFYEALKNCKELDLRDKRGKVHCVGLVLIGVFIGLYRNRDGVLSSIHRSIKNTHLQLCRHLGIANSPPISRAQLPLVLKKIDIDSFSRLLFDFIGVVLNEGEKQWFAADGKELRGSIAKGEKRGEAVVQAVSHANREVHGQAFYNGQKESERPCVQQLLEATGLCHQKITLDALHLIPQTLTQIAGGPGTYLIGLKENQKELYADMVKVSESHKAIHTFKEVEKSHGRIDKTMYRSYSIVTEFFDERWAGASFQTWVKVERASVQLKTKVESREISYYLSNGMIKDRKDVELFRAVRGHWNVETNNYIRDVTFKEDHLQTKEPILSKVMACGRTLALTFLHKLNLKNRKEKLEEFADNFDTLINWMAHLNFLYESRAFCNQYAVCPLQSILSEAETQ